MQQAHDPSIVVVLRLVMKAANNMHLGRSSVHRLLPTSDDLLVRHPVALFITQISAERAERTPIHTDVRRVQMRVDVVVREVAILSLTHQVGQLAKLRQRDLVGIEQHSVVESEPLTGFDFLAYRF